MGKESAKRKEGTRPKKTKGEMGGRGEEQNRAAENRDRGRGRERGDDV